ncbi:MAG: LysR family transcriptional regulator [Tissierellia bacterium]|nr:LysR family transcriptional regulator [Tissierellia bacterium]
MTIRHLRIFIEVAKSGNMSKAAERLYISQPTASQAIKELEEYYGVLLFERLNRRLYITEAGKKLFFYAKKVVKEFDDLEERMANINKVEGIKIGATISVGDCILGDIISRLKDVNPKAEIYSYVGNTETIENKLLNNQLDIAIVEGKVKSPDLIVRPELEDYLVLICSSNHPFAQKKTIELEELANEKFAMREKGSGTRELFEEYMQKKEIPIKVVFEGNTPAAIKQEVIINNCLAAISICLVEEEANNSTIHIIESEKKSWNRYFSIVYHKDKVLSDLMKSLIKITKNYQHIPKIINKKPGVLMG